nr:phospholipase-like protein [Tanacetum cinerariifolium]
LKTRRLEDRVIRELNVRVFKLGTIIQVLALERNDKLGRLQFNKDLYRLRGDFVESLNILLQDSVDPHDSVEDIANEYLVDEELNCVWKKNGFVRNRKREFNMRRDVSRLFHSMDTIWLSDDIERFISQPRQLKSMFPWSDDYTISKNLWLRLVCLDPCRKGWLSEEHIDLWVDYMGHGRRENANWALVSCYFVQLLMQNIMPLFYVNGDKYGIPWSDVDQLYLLALSANSLLVKDIMVKLFEIENERDLRTIADTYAMCPKLYVRCHERREQMLKMQSFLHVLTSLAESYKLLEELQDFELEKMLGLDEINKTNEKPENYVIFEVNYDGVFNLHLLSVGDELGLHDNWLYKGLSLDGPIDFGAQVCPNLQVVLKKKKGRSMVKVTRKRKHQYYKKINRFRKLYGKRVSVEAGKGRLGGLVALNDHEVDDDPQLKS